VASDGERRGPGRPSILGADSGTLRVRISRESLEALDELAEKRGEVRSEAARRLIEQGLELDRKLRRRR